MVLPFVPASNILQTVGFVAAERTLYMPSLGRTQKVVPFLHLATIESHIKEINKHNTSLSEGPSSTLNLLLRVLNYI